MYNFTDLIARSYLQHTKEKDDDVAHFFFQEFYKVRPGAEGDFIFAKEQFYRKVIDKFDYFLRSCVHNYEVELSTYYDVYNEPKDFEAWERIDLKRKQDTYNDQGIFFTLGPVNWEEIQNAGNLNEALINGLNLVDPITIISPSKKIQPEKIVLRKSKLEYLKTEAIRARDANSIEDLENSLKDTESSINSFVSENEIKVKKAFEFTLKLGKNKKQILSNDDHLRLVKWVTFYFDNNYELPIIDTPISELNIGVTYIRYAFKLLIDQIHTPYARPESFYTLVPLCFKDLEKDTTKDIQATSKPANWEKFTP